jgi:cytochrome c peroxidase
VRTAYRLPFALLLCCIAYADRPSKIELGRRLFMDPTVSRGGRFSCASCHSPEHGFSDPRALSEDENGPTLRHSQPLLDLKDGVGMHWDGEFFRVRELLVARLASASEARDQARTLAKRHFAAARGEGDRATFERRLRETAPPYYEGADATIVWAAPLARRLEEEGRYDALFRNAFGSRRVTTERLVDAMEAYVLSLGAGTSAYDRYVAGKKDALSAAARRGLDLFEGKAGCAECHSGSRFTDDLYHNTGVASVAEKMDTGRGSRSFLASDTARFKTPSLRDVARRAPYMHDGAFPTLRSVVLYYDRGATANASLDPHIRRLDLAESEIDDLVAFLDSLTSDERPGLGRAVRHRTDTRVRIEDLEGKPIEGLAVRIESFGDRLGEEGASGAVLDRTTDKHGRITFRFPDWTHVKLTARGLSLGEGQPLPDSTREATVIAAPRTKTAVRIKGSELPDQLVANSGGLGIGNVVLRMVRKLGADEALYVADHFTEGTAVFTFKLPEGAVSRRYAMDISNGFTAMIDLRPDPDPSAPPNGDLAVFPRKAIENLPGGNMGDDPASARRR